MPGNRQLSTANSLPSVYSADWFARRAGYRPVYLRFAQAIDELWHPRSILDVGCGAGWLLEHWVCPSTGSGQARRCRAWGVDGSAAALDAQSQVVRPCTVLFDLTAGPWLLHDLLCDLAVSIEVAEHIPPEHVEGFLRWFDGADRVLLTAAPPGQGGNHHINEQPQSYWIALFEKRGLRYDLAGTEAWKALARSKTKGCPWVVRNAMVFLKAGVAQPFDIAHGPEPAEGPPPAVDAVLPDKGAA